EGVVADLLFRDRVEEVRVAGEHGVGGHTVGDFGGVPASLSPIRGARSPGCTRPGRGRRPPRAAQAPRIAVSAVSAVAASLTVCATGGVRRTATVSAAARTPATSAAT